MQLSLLILDSLMYKYELIKSELITPTVLLLSLKPAGSRFIKFYPGQYAAISFKRFGRPTPMRCFSIVSSPRDNDIVQFAIRVEGDFTNAAKEIKQGNIFSIRGPFGEFVIDEEIDKSVVLLAGGIGVAPFMSMIRFATETKLKIPIVLLYSCQNQNDVSFFKDLINLEKQNSHFKVAFFISDGNIDKLVRGRVYEGRINEGILDKVTNRQYDQYTHFICGPTKFINAMQSILVRNNVSPEHLITEAFGQGLVTEKSHKKPSLETTFVYGATGALLVMATFLITAVDLVRAVPKISKIETTQSSSNSTKSTSASSTSNSSGAGQTMNTQSASSTPTQTQTVSPNPITSVS